MNIGSLGNIPFYVGAQVTQTINDLKWKSTAKYAIHERHGGVELLEFTGLEPSEITIKTELSAFLGVNPMNVLDQLGRMMNSAESVKFVLGLKPIGSYWVIGDISRDMDRFYKDGTLVSCKVQITIREYERTAQMPIVTNRIAFVDRMISRPVVQPSPIPEVRAPVIAPTAKKVGVSSKAVTKPPVSSGKVSGGSKPPEVKPNAVKNSTYREIKSKANTSVIVRPAGSANKNITQHLK